MRVWVPRGLVALALLGAWQLIASTSEQAAAFLSTPADVLEVVRTWLVGEHNVRSHMVSTAVVAFQGLLLGTLAATLSALVLAHLGRLRHFLDPFLALLNVVPKVTLLPLFILWLGIGDESKIAFVATGVFFIVFFNVLESVEQAAQGQRDHLRVLGAGRLRIVWELLLPTAWGSLLSSVRLSVAFALLGTVLAEMLGSNQGLGFLLANGQALLASDQVMAAIIIVATMGVVLDMVLAIVDTRVARWRRA